jgi:Nif-specific regulatory protein
MNANPRIDLKQRLFHLELQVLHKISAMVGEALQLPEALDTILEILSNTLAMERGTITLRDPVSAVLQICASHGLTSEETARGTYQPGEGITGTIFRSGQPFAVADIGKEPLFLNRMRARNLKKEDQAFVGVPIMLGNEPIGVLTVDRLFGSEISLSEDIRFLSIVAALIAQFVLLNRRIREREASLVAENRHLRAEISEKYNNFFAVGVSRAMQELNRMIRRVAPSRASVLLLGESGTGKTLTARIIHEMSGRCRHPFVKVNCASLSTNLIEAELFGFEKGAFTGAQEPKQGRLEGAHTGTIFLDEIGELPLGVQSKLLQFIQEREVQRLGSTRVRQVDVRIIAATNVDLNQAVQAGRFRSDLFYRLNVFPIQVPPLRHRLADIPLLVAYFVQRITREYGHPFSFSPGAVETLARYSWPGNVRELENVIERMAIMADGAVVQPQMLPDYLSHEANGLQDLTAQNGQPPTCLADMERDTILNALASNGWVQHKAARDIGLTARQIGYRVKKYGLEETIRHNRRQASLSSP